MPSEDSSRIQIARLLLVERKLGDVLTNQQNIEERLSDVEFTLHEVVDELAKMFTEIRRMLRRDPEVIVIND